MIEEIWCLSDAIYRLSEQDKTDLTLQAELFSDRDLTRKFNSYRRKGYNATRIGNYFP